MNLIISSLPPFTLTRNTFHFKFHKTHAKRNAVSSAKLKFSSSFHSFFVSLYISRSIPQVDEIRTHNWSERQQQHERSDVEFTSTSYRVESMRGRPEKKKHSPIEKRSVLSHQGATTWDEWVWLERGGAPLLARLDGDLIDMIDDFYVHHHPLSFVSCLSSSIGIMFV